MTVRRITRDCSAHWDNSIKDDMGCYIHYEHHTVTPNGSDHNEGKCIDGTHSLSFRQSFHVEATRNLISKSTRLEKLRC